ncbi:MAG TPA: 2-C-methyl-D-erythritol 4-phosphate cytidylyltransferase [Candidatus Limnocylindrales bacterium]|nr:2-C-methyl-D-erythritol 4-phosphate cytidylyltransferase [Candidatus Limnocylindrales bacterium]
MRTVLAVLAAGSSRRAGEDKILADLGGRPVVCWSLAAAAVSGAFDAVVVVAPPERRDAVAGAVADSFPDVRVVAGGATRTASAWAALDAAGDAELVGLHDAARPFVTPSLLARCVEVAAREGSAVAGLPLADTVRRADEAGRTLEEVAREGLWQVQTPQVFRRELLVRARAAAGDRAFSDDAAALIAAGLEVRMVHGERRNLKITTMEDLGYARELVAKGLVGVPALRIS